MEKSSKNIIIEPTFGVIKDTFVGWILDGIKILSAPLAFWTLALVCIILLDFSELL